MLVVSSVNRQTKTTRYFGHTGIFRKNILSQTRGQPACLGANKKAKNACESEVVGGFCLSIDRQAGAVPNLSMLRHGLCLVSVRGCVGFRVRGCVRFRVRGCVGFRVMGCVELGVV